MGPARLVNAGPDHTYFAFAVRRVAGFGAFAGFGGFKEATSLEATESPEERKPVKVSFS